MKKAMIAMSGGVDSSVAAYLMKKSGYEVVGGMLKLHTQKDFLSQEKGCCTTSDILDAESVAGKLNIPFHLFNYQADFEKHVINKFIDCYKTGGTPNPCVDCNKNIKFKFMLQQAEEMGCDFVATGHYAIVEKDENSGRYILRKAKDLSKDQSYVLYSLTQEQLKKIKFPLGGITKEQARKIAEENQLVTAHKSDSQDICFIPDGNYGKFIENFAGEKFPKGKFLNNSGKVLGEHQGIIKYTIGQRKGLGLALPAPLYVLSKDAVANTVTLGTNEELFSTSLDANEINLITVPFIEGEMHVKAKVRYKQNEQWATVTQTGNDTIHVEFDQPQRAISRGQAVVLYIEDAVVGGGTII